ncbi:MAG: hypothetical protein K9G41_04860 [Flavobacteriales bacterium]|nr:hypothetical protein [Flavobacteriales bacterium]
MKVLFILLTCASLSVSAQKVEFGEDFNNVGVLKNPGTEWTASSWPKVLTVMYTNGKTTINGNAMNLLFKSETEGKVKTDSVKLVIGQARNWAALRHEFTTANTYTVSAYDREWKFLASGVIKVNGPAKPAVVAVVKPEPAVKKSEPVAKVEPMVEAKKEEKIVAVEAPTKKAELTKQQLLENAPEPVFVESVIKEELTEEEKETLVFESFYIAFGRAVQSGMLTGQNEKFKGVPGGVDLKALFSNNEGFGGDGVSVDIWFRPQGEKEFSQHFQELTVPIAKDVTQASFPMNLRDRGTYKVSLYTANEDAVWIGSGYVSIY